MRVPVTTTIDKEQYDLIKKNNWRMNELIDLGCGAKANYDIQQEKIKEFEHAQTDFVKTIKKLHTRVSWLEAMQKEEEANDEATNNE